MLGRFFVRVWTFQDNVRELGREREDRKVLKYGIGRRKKRKNNTVIDCLLTLKKKDALKLDGRTVLLFSLV